MARRLNDDDVFLPFNEAEYRAVVNPTNLTILAVAYGRRFTFVPGELDNPRRAPVQMMKVRMARKAQKSQRRFLELMSVEQGFRLMKLARKLGDFQEAFRRITGRSAKKAGELLMERQERNSLRRVLLHNVGVPDEILKNWTIGDMRAVIKDETLAGDLDDVTGRPRIGGGMASAEGRSIFDVATSVNNTPVENLGEPVDMTDFQPVDDGGPTRLLDGNKRVPETGLPGDFVDIMSLDEEELLRQSDAEASSGAVPLPEEVAAAAAAKYDAEHGGIVKGKKPRTVELQEKTFKGLAAGETVALDVKDLERPMDVAPVELPKATEREKVLALRQQIEKIGGTWHPRSGSDRLQRDLDELIASAVNAEAPASE